MKMSFNVILNCMEYYSLINVVGEIEIGENKICYAHSSKNSFDAVKWVLEDLVSTLRRFLMSEHSDVNYVSLNLTSSNGTNLDRYITIFEEFAENNCIEILI